MAGIAAWLEANGLEKYISVFAENDIDAYVDSSTVTAASGVIDVLATSSTLSVATEKVSPE